jgi:hypothetical protein
VSPNLSQNPFTREIDEVVKSCPKPVLDAGVRAHRLGQIRHRLHTLRLLRSSIEADRPRNWAISRPTLDAIEHVEREMQQLLDERKRLRIDRPRWLDVTLQARLGNLREVARAEFVDRHELNNPLRSLLYLRKS